MKYSHKATAIAAAIAMPATILAVGLADDQVTMEGYVNGNRLFKVCSATQNDFRYLECVSYITGVVDGTVAYAVDLGRPLADCPPQGVRTVQLTDVVRHYLKANPEKRHEQAASLVIASVTGAFHCVW
jgi:hypothetical protein